MNDRSLHIHLVTEFTAELDTDFLPIQKEQDIVLLKFLTLINSSSTDCFIDSKYIEKKFYSPFRDFSC